MSDPGSRRDGALTPPLADLVRRIAGERSADVIAATICEAVRELTGAAGCRITAAGGSPLAEAGDPPAGPVRSRPLAAGEGEAGLLELWGGDDPPAGQLDLLVQIGGLALRGADPGGSGGRAGASPVLAAIGRFAPAISLADAADQLLDAVRAILRAPAAALILDGLDDLGQATFREGFGDHGRPGDPLPASGRRALAAGRSWSGSPAADAGRAGFTALLAAPLGSLPPLAGALVALRRGPAFTIDDRRLLEGLAQGSGLLLAGGHRAERARALAAVDPVRMLGDANYFRLRLAQEIGRAERCGHSLAVVLIRADGDAAPVRALADRARREVRGADVVCRLDDRELAVLLPDLTGMGAMLVSERLRARLGAAGGRTVSAGVAGFPDAGTSASEMAASARRALGWAREHGADRSFLYAPALAGELDAERRAREERSVAIAGTLDALAVSVDLRLGGGRHSVAVARLCELIGAELGLAPERMARLRRAGLVHDVGMIGVREALLSWPGALPERDLREVREHPQIGFRLLAEAGLEREREWILHHHERVDGGGYPAGLRGEAIPLEARIIAVAEAYDAITAERPYRPARSSPQALAELMAHAGSQFDEAAVAALAALAGRGLVGMRGA